MCQTSCSDMKKNFLSITKCKKTRSNKSKTIVQHNKIFSRYNRRSKYSVFIYRRCQIPPWHKFFINTVATFTFFFQFFTLSNGYESFLRHPFYDAYSVLSGWSFLKVWGKRSENSGSIRIMGLIPTDSLMSIVLCRSFSSFIYDSHRPPDKEADRNYKFNGHSVAITLSWNINCWINRRRPTLATTVQDPLQRISYFIHDNVKPHNVEWKSWWGNFCGGNFQADLQKSMSSAVNKS